MRRRDSECAAQRMMETEQVADKFGKASLTWFGHVLKRDRMMLEMDLPSKKGRGKPQ